MQTVELTAIDSTGHVLFSCLGMGMSYASAKASAKVGYRARVADEKVHSRVALVEYELV